MDYELASLIRPDTFVNIAPSVIYLSIFTLKCTQLRSNGPKPTAESNKSEIRTRKCQGQCHFSALPLILQLYFGPIY